jgi:hypothetical protein
MTNDIWGLVAYWNPCGYRSRRLNFEVFRRHINIPLIVVEMRTTNRPPDLSVHEAEIYLEVSPGAELWQKERLYNLALGLVPNKVKYVAALDADILFGSPDWAAKAVRTLDRCPVVQLWNRVRFLKPGSLEIPDTDEGMTEAKSSASELACGRETDIVSETGRAWIMHKDLIRRHGFYDRSIVGSGDLLFAAAVYGKTDTMILHGDPKVSLLNTSQVRHFSSWAHSFNQDVRARGKSTCLNETIYHLWHGSTANRRYVDRHVGLLRYDFNPDADLKIGLGGAWEWNSNKSDMHSYVRDYLLNRNEDDNFIE